MLTRIVDPWFNFRATKYLVQNGFYSFWDWFDDRKHIPASTYLEHPKMYCQTADWATVAESFHLL